ncbi:MAG: hypothetical protein U9R47_00465 [Actinomycetota bacterium]|nr:hypothetical protein [Actinomycetota bacterium]
MRRIIYPLIWLAVTVTAVLIASAAVSSVRDQVTDTPTAAASPTTIALRTTEQAVLDPTELESSSPTSIDEPIKTTTTTTTTTPPATTTIPLQSTTTVPTTTVPSSPDPTTTTTTTAPTTTAPTTEIRSYELVGGSVSVEISSETVRLAGASPKPGFTMEVENSGPEKVEVEFHSEDHESHFSGKIEDGEFKPSIDESDDEDDD